MKKLYSLFALIALLFTASGCEDDYRIGGVKRNAINRVVRKNSNSLDK